MRKLQNICWLVGCIAMWLGIALFGIWDNLPPVDLLPGR